MRWALVILVAVSACKKGDPKKCDVACRNYAQLDFWHGADKRIEALPADQREAARKTELATFQKNLELGIDTCVSKCVDANYDKDVSCWTNAKTYEELQKCKD
ncbi:MAG: hypothetical protein JO257_13410 [Deltaproteobacteria bacterium]|nr:hypothetical protein [Deltaproteobacteria bacterium]